MEASGGFAKGMWLANKKQGEFTVKVVNKYRLNGFFNRKSE